MEDQNINKLQIQGEKVLQVKIGEYYEMLAKI